MVIPAAIEVSKASAVGVIASLLGLLLWFILHVKRRRIWFPIVRVIALKATILPKFKLTWPPVIPFLGFVISIFALVLFSLRPQENSNLPVAPKESHVHFFIDFSPSVAAHTTLDRYRDIILSAYNAIGSNVKKTVSTSHSNEVFEPTDAASLGQMLEPITFHRGGAFISTALETQLPLIGDVDRLFIFSDQDAHSWNNFNWAYLLDRMDVHLVRTEDSTGDVPNYFINSVNDVSEADSNTSEWDVEIECSRRSGKSADKAQGTITVTFDGIELQKVDWHLAPDAKQVRLRVSVPQPKGPITEPNPALIWDLHPQGPDALLADNRFRTELTSFHQTETWMVADPQGEQILEDPAYQLKVSLSILGLKPIRYDGMGKVLAPFLPLPLWVFFLSNQKSLASQCPLGLREAFKAQANPNTNRDHPLHVWLAPYQLDDGYQAICQCYARLTSTAPENPRYCDDVSTRDRFDALMVSLGAKQVGGEIERPQQSIAFLGTELHAPFDVLAFTLPLRPSRATGVTHGQLPLVVRDLLRWQGVVAGERIKGAEWPRYADIASDPAWVKSGGSDALFASLSNVPRGESQLLTLPAINLPPMVALTDLASLERPHAKGEPHDPRMWIRLCMFAIIFAMALEGAFLLLRSLRVRRRKDGAPDRLWNRLVVLLLVIGVSPSFKGWAKVQIPYLGSVSTEFDLESATKEINHRTSLDFDSIVKVSDELNLKNLDQGWLWANTLDKLVQSNGRLTDSMLLWLKRGGFLILEGTFVPQTLAQLTSALAPKSPTDPKWSVIPPDHELMRSFYLLDALPSCNGQSWQGLHYDGRLAILVIPFGLLDSFRAYKTDPLGSVCGQPVAFERQTRILINVLMVALTTDYKKDQIHMQKTLKRLH